MYLASAVRGDASEEWRRGAAGGDGGAARGGGAARAEGTASKRKRNIARSTNPNRRCIAALADGVHQECVMACPPWACVSVRPPCCPPACAVARYLVHICSRYIEYIIHGFVQLHESRPSADCGSVLRGENRCSGAPVHLDAGLCGAWGRWRVQTAYIQLGGEYVSTLSIPIRLGISRRKWPLGIRQRSGNSSSRTYDACVRLLSSLVLCCPPHTPRESKSAVAEP